eukprot:6202805-Pleurochrysis_carterae.AAC.2
MFTKQHRCEYLPYRRNARYAWPSLPEAGWLLRRLLGTMAASALVSLAAALPAPPPQPASASVR